MLVLSRKAGEGFLIGDDITVKIIESKSGTIRIGIDAPRDKKIFRQEVYDIIKQENVEASKLNTVDLDSLGSVIKTRNK